MDRVELEQWKGREVARLLALVETERRYYQEIVASLPIGLAVVARDGAIQSANRAFRVLFGLRTEDVYRRTLDQLISSGDLLDTVRNMPSRNAAASSQVVEAASRSLRVSVVPIRDWDDDTDLEALLVIEDLTGVSSRSALRDVPALIWTANAQSLEFTVVSGDAAAVAHPGFASARIHAGDRDRVVEFYRWALATPGPHACEYRAEGSGGNMTWYRDAFTVTAHEGEPLKAAGVVTDITERVQSEQIAYQANRLDALTGISRTLAHDLNNPLMIVTGYGEDLLGTMPEVDARRSDMKEILDAAHRIGDITGQLLAFTRKQAQPAAPVSVAEVFTRINGAPPPESEVPPHLRALADPAQLEEALSAILQRLRRDGAASVEVSAVQFGEQVPDGLPHGRYIRITFNAIVSSALSFEGFAGGKDAAAPGLARAHALVHEWGGGIWQSQDQVHVLLPAGADVEPPKPVVEPPAPVVESTAVIPLVEHPAPPEPGPRLETILVVEDEGGIRALVRKILRRQNYEVLEAATPDEATALVESHGGQIDLLITDMTLPQRNGRELAEELKAKLPNLRVLYVSGYTDDLSVYDREMLPAGAAFLQKPFTLGSLLKKVREVLDQSI